MDLFVLPSSVDRPDDAPAPAPAPLVKSARMIFNDPPGNEHTARTLATLKHNMRVQLQDSSVDLLPAHHRVDAWRIGVGRQPLLPTSSASGAASKPPLSAQHEVLAIAGRLEMSPDYKLADLNVLCFAFLQSPVDHVNTFLRSPFAIQALIAGLRMPDEQRRQLASECVCNMALGNEEQCRRVAANGGRELMAALLDGADERAQTVALWTLSNVCASPRATRAVQIVLGLGAVSQLLALLGRDASGEELKLETLLTLNVLVTQHAGMLR